MRFFLRHFLMDDTNALKAYALVCRVAYGRLSKHGELDQSVSLTKKSVAWKWRKERPGGKQREEKFKKFEFHSNELLYPFLYELTK